jgi:pyridoxal phosphate enzyme (YggS family)
MLPEQLRRKIESNLARVRERVARAGERAGRRPDEVKIIAVSKGATDEAVRALVELGCTDVAESRPQALWNRTSNLANLDARWHLIGHLQRNKVQRTLPLVTMIQSVDSERLLRAIHDLAEEGRTVTILLETNISGDAEKHGFQPEAVATALDVAGAMPNIRVLGLMAMASRLGGAATARRNFAALRGLRDRLAPACPPGVSLAELSMGMSGDFEEGILEGATMVRIGSALLEGATE